MSTDRRYFFYSVVQYVHDRREERLNVGVVVHDPHTSRVIPRVSANRATRRIKSLYPDVDRTGLQLYLEDLVRTIPFDSRVRKALESNTSPLDVLEDEWNHIVQFSPARVIPATDAAAAIRALTLQYLDERPRTTEREAVGAVERTRIRTRDAIARVLHLTPGLPGFSEFHEVYEEWVGNRLVKFQLEFPFLILDDFAVDAISLETSGPREAERQAESFVRKVERLLRFDSSKRPYATVAPDPQRMEHSLDMIAWMRATTGLGAHQVRLVDEAEAVAEDIKQQIPHAA
jgi:hypothetical protein